jgi:tetratricopeptide (TPR) repeat protein
MSRELPGRSVFVFVLIGGASVSAQLTDYQEQYFVGMRAMQQGRYVEAHASLQALYERARTLPSDDEWKVRAVYGLGSLSRMEGDCRKAEQLQREATTLLEHRGGPPSPIHAFVANGLGEALLEQARYDEAEEAFTHALRIAESDPEMKQVAFLCRRHLAEIQFMRQDFAGAEKLFKKLIADERMEHVYGDLAGVLDVLGRLYLTEHRWREAEPLLREAVERDLQSGEQSPALADSRTTLATLYRVEGHIDRAEPLLRKALKTYETNGDAHAATVYVQLSWCALAEHKYMTARELLQKAVDVAVGGSMSEVFVSRLRDELAAVTQAGRPVSARALVH